MSSSLGLSTEVMSEIVHVSKHIAPSMTWPNIRLENGRQIVSMIVHASKKISGRKMIDKSYPLNILSIISSIEVIFSWVVTNLLLRDSARGPSALFLFSAFNCLWVVSRCEPSIFAIVINDVTSWRPTTEAIWRKTRGGVLENVSKSKSAKIKLLKSPNAQAQLPYHWPW